MNNTPKCPGCGREMVLREDFHKFFFVCLDCGWKSPYGQNEKEGLDLALKRVEPKNRVLTLEEATGSDEPVWLEAMSRVFIADVCVSPDARMAQIQTIGEASCAYLPLCDYGVLWRCWLRKPTKEEMEGRPWEN